MERTLLLMALLLAQPCAAAPWFTYQTTVSPPGFAAVMAGGAPKSNTDANFPRYPGTVFWDQEPIGDMGSTETTRAVLHNIWAYNYTEGASLKPDPNPVPGSNCGLRFSDNAHATAGWLAEVAQSVGYGQTDTPFGYRTLLHAAGFKDAQIYTYPAFIAAAPKICSPDLAQGRRGTLVAPIDTEVLPDGNLYQLPVPKLGVMANYLASDGRSCAYTLAVLSEYAAIVHSKGYLAGIQTNRIDTGNKTGIDAGFCATRTPGANTDMILNSIVDFWYVGEPADPPTDPVVGLADELGAFQQPALAKLGIRVDMLHSPPLIVNALYAMMVRMRMRGIFWWPNLSTLGSPDPCNMQNQSLGYGTGNPPEREGNTQC